MKNLDLNEIKNVLSIYWQMLQEIEGRTNPKKDILDKILVESAYTTLNKLGYTQSRPNWDRKD